MKKTLIVLISCFLISTIFAQTQQPSDLLRKKVNATRIDKAPNIDGDLSDEAWEQATSIATDFITLDPTFGNKATYKSHIKVVYDNTGIYVSAMMYDDEPYEIGHELVERDGIGNADWFGVFIDPYGNGNNGVEFIVTAAGVQFDAKATPNGEDESWDAVWKSDVKIVENGWIAEMKIPYSALRFPNVEEQLWRINFGRKINRTQEKVFWSEINPKVDGFLTQFGELKGIQGIKSPVRLSATPFLAVYGLHSKDDEGNSNYGRTFNGGMDIKYGINDAFTLDMTLIPDFGEAKSDEEILNLGPFERQYNENRQFFTEGTELFSKGRLFYSRRIGAAPLHYWDIENNLKDGESIEKNPAETQLLNATKLSGRTASGLGIGWFNATAAKQKATIKNTEGASYEVETSPLTNYNVFVLDQSLKNNSSISLINTTVFREGEDYEANVTGLTFDLLNKKKSYGVEGKAVLSQKYLKDSVALGHTYNLGFRKISGNFTFGLSYGVESDTYDPNDLGFLYNNNEKSVNLWMNYNIFKPKKIFNRLNFGAWSGYNHLYQPNVFTSWGVNFWAWGQTKGFWNLNVGTYFEPIKSYDYFEARVEGRFYESPTFANFRFNVNSDRRKPVRFNVNARFVSINESNRHSFSYGFGPTFRISDKFTFGLYSENQINIGQVGFVDHVYENDLGENPDVIFGRRDRNTVTSNIFVNYNFNNKMSLSLRVYHYWTKGEYTSFHLLNEEGHLEATDYTTENDFSFNAFNVDLQYRWRFAPGSDIFVVWKNNIIKDDNPVNFSYLDNVKTLFSGAQRNQLSLKMIYFLDYLYLTKKR